MQRSTKILRFSTVSFHKEHYKIYQLLRSNDSKRHFQQRGPLYQPSVLMLSLPAWCTWLKNCQKPQGIGKALSSGGGCRKGLWEDRLLPELREIHHRQSSVFRAFYGTLILRYRRNELQRIFPMTVALPLKRSRGEAAETTSSEVLKAQKWQDWPDAAWAITLLQAGDWTTAFQKYLPINVSTIERCSIFLWGELMKLTEGHVFSLLFSSCFRCTHHCLQTSWKCPKRRRIRVVLISNTNSCFWKPASHSLLYIKMD